MNLPRKDLTNALFGRLTVISFQGRNKQKDSLWLCLCKCGTKKIIRGGVLKNGHTRSCGCLQKERACETHKKHGLIKNNYKLYKVWIGIKQRCYNQKDSSFKNYGKRGIAVCDQWRNDFRIFHKWAKETGYKKGLSIERRNVNGHYNPSNCYWIPKSEQSRNRTTSVIITYNGKTLNASDWSDKIGIPSRVLTQRIRRGWTPKRTLTTDINR